jgi:hypothetical protein
MGHLVKYAREKGGGAVIPVAGMVPAGKVMLNNQLTSPAPW